MSDADVRPGARPDSTAPSSVPADASSPASSAQPAGGGANATRDSTKRRADRARAGSSSPPGGAYPTDVTCVPGGTSSTRTTGVGEAVVRQITSAPAIEPR